MILGKPTDRKPLKQPTTKNQGGKSITVPHPSVKGWQILMLILRSEARVGKLQTMGKNWCMAIFCTVCKLIMVFSL